MVLTADDASYTAPAVNFVKKGVWKDNSEGISAYVQRPPMIGMVNSVFYFTGGNKGFAWQKYLAVILHGIALFLFGLMATQGFGKRTGIIAQSIYAIIPCFWGYLFYFLTESITPSLVVFLMYGYVQFQQKNSPKWLFFQAFIIGVLLLTRPQLGVVALPFIYFLGVYIQHKYHHKWLTVVLSILLAFGGFSAWQWRTFTITNGSLSIHPIYSITNRSQYRPVHRSLGELFKIWEHNSEKFHGIITPFWNEVYNQDKNVAYALNSIPPRVYAFVPRSEFKSLFEDYQNSQRQVNTTFWPSNAHRVIQQEPPDEKMVRLKADSITRLLKRKMWKENYIITPLHSAQWMFTKSQLNLKIFQAKYRGFWWMEGLRYFSVILLLLLTCLSITQIANRKNKMFLLMAFSILVYLFYLFFIQKMNEERYLVPFLPVMLLLGVDRLVSIFKKRKG
jgi:4-amino-4-deoxy-L-arabinose transferase-like glycosyltransferase